MPFQLSSFIGRERDITTANRLLHQTRLLTLTGPGGCGKTRLAVAMAQGLARRYPGGVWMVELAAISDPELVPQAIAIALELREMPGRPLLDTLAAYLNTKRLLLVLDNCEHLIAACASVAHALLSSCPGLRILATSREPLHVTGETTWTPPPLAVPDVAALPPLEELRKIESVRLFVDRAAHITPGFAVDKQNGLAISQICSWLAGSPLAIELAAARTRVLSPEQIAARLGDALAFLATTDRTVPARHKTLQATLDWSYDLLSAGEQSLFRCLAVFAASFSVEAVEAVYALNGPGDTGRERTTGSPGDGRAFDVPPVLELLTGLVDKSLLAVETQGADERRFRYLDPVRQYALAKLEHAGEGSQARGRLLAWAVALAEHYEPHAYTATVKQSSEQLEIEHANLRAALRWAVSCPQCVVEGHRLASALGQFWQNWGYIGEGLAWLEQLLTSLHQVPVRLQINTLISVAFLAMHARDFARARSWLEQAIRISEELPDRYGLATLYHLLCFLTFNEGDLVEAERLCVQTLRMFEESGDDLGRAIVLFYQANIAYLQQDYRRAMEVLQESVEICRRIGAISALARRLVRLGQIHEAMGDAAEASACLAVALRTSREAGDNWATAMSAAALGSLARAQGQHERAAWLLGVTQHLRDAFGVPLWTVDEIEYERTRSAVRTELGDAAFQEAIERGVRQATQDVGAALEAALEARAPHARRATDASPNTKLPPREDASGALSRREREVAALVAQGKSNAEIAATLFVGVRTVEAHVTHILNKLGFNSRSQIAAWVAAQPH